MNKTHKLLLSFAFAVIVGCGEQAQSQAQTAPQPAATPAVETAAPPSAEAPANGYIAGTHYERLPKPVPTSDKTKIEVTEVFWYGCSHCFDFEPKLAAWSKNQNNDVILVKNPAMWDNQGIMERHARIYYAAKVLGVVDKVGSAAFRALNVERKGLRSDAEIAELFTANGVSQQDFDRTFNSFGVTSSVRQSEARQRSYRVQGTPELIVDGTYRVTAGMAGSQDGMLKVTDFLIAKIRQEKSAQ